MKIRSFVLVVAGLAFVAGTGCNRSVDFDIHKTFDPVNATGGVPFEYSDEVSLADEAGSAWKHRKNIRSLDLVGVEATVVRNYSGVATTGSGTVVISRPGLDDVTLGTFTNHTIPANVPDSISVTLNKAGVALIENALHGDGRFTVWLKGQTAATVSFALEVTLHVEMTYRVP